MAGKLDSSEKLLAGVVLTVVGLAGLVYRSTACGFVGESGMFYSGGYSLLSLIISAIFIIVTILGIYIVYDTIKKDTRV